MFSATQNYETALFAKAVQPARAEILEGIKQQLVEARVNDQMWRASRATQRGIPPISSQTVAFGPQAFSNPPAPLVQEQA